MFDDYNPIGGCIIIILLFLAVCILFAALSPSKTEPKHDTPNQHAQVIATEPEYSFKKVASLETGSGMVYVAVLTNNITGEQFLVANSYNNGVSIQKIEYPPTAESTPNPLMP